MVASLCLRCIRKLGMRRKQRRNEETMKYIKGILIIYTFTLLGEWMNRLLPFAIPAGVYGLFLLLAALCTGLVRLEWVEASGGFLLEIMPMLFIPVSVGLMETVAHTTDLLLPLTVISALTTVIVMAVTGVTAERVICHKKKAE